MFERSRSKKLSKEFRWGLRGLNKGFLKAGTTARWSGSSKIIQNL